MSDTVRPYRVHARPDRHHARTVREASFEAAALAFLDDHLHDGEETSLVICDLTTGQEHCFRLDLEPRR